MKPVSGLKMLAGVGVVEVRSGSVVVGTIAVHSDDEAVVDALTKAIAALPQALRQLHEVERVLKAWHKDKGEWAALRDGIHEVLRLAGEKP